MAPPLNYQEYFIPCTNVKLINKDDRGGGEAYGREQCVTMTTL